MSVIFLNGEFVARDSARVSVFDHGYLYGDGIFEGIRAYNWRVFRLDEHLDRLYESARTIMLQIPLTKVQMREAVLETLRRNGLRDGYIRLVISRGPGDLGLDPRKCPQATVVVIAENIQLYSQQAYTRGIRAITTTAGKIRPDMLSPQVKSLNYLGNILARIEVNQAGADEGIMLNADGYVTECTADNIFIVHRGELWTPPAFLGILKGVTRDTVLDLARTFEIHTEDRVFTLHDVYTADECFLTGAFRARVQAEGAPIYPQEAPAGTKHEAA